MSNEKSSKENMKSNMIGAREYYTRMFKQLMEWGEPMGRHNDLYAHGTHRVLGNEENHYIYDLGFLTGDMPYHGWTGDDATNERDIEKRVSTAYYCLVKALAEAIGYDYEEYDPKSSMYEYHLKDLDVNKVLDWRKNHG